MSLVNCQHMCVSFAQRDILTDISFEIAAGDRVGLIGANGSGKTTLFRVLSGVLECTSGTVIKAKDTMIGFVEQHACQGSTRSVYDELLTVFSQLSEMEKELERLHKTIETENGTNAENIDLQAVLTESYQHLGGLTYKARARSCLMGLGFTEAEQSLEVSALSGGQRTKLSLGKLLLSEPSLLLLDEPTNHLDIKSVEWLEDFMEKYQGAAIVISHDRYFLDRVTNRTMEISGKKLYCAKGSYTVFMKNKELMLETQRREYDKAQSEIKRLEKMIEQQQQFNRERNYITIASKEKQIERIRETMPVLPDREREVKLRFKTDVRSGDEVLIAENLRKEYDGKLLFDDVNLKIFRGERVFLIGPNGCGKSTLLNMLMGKIPKDKGRSRFGHAVKVGFYEQTQHSLMSGKTILSEIYDRFPALSVPEIRSYLGAFNFRNDDIEKNMSDLSGGERARVALLILMLLKPNFLILDEPTNHLDIASREVLESSLDSFDGTLLAVSHDRYFVNRLATKIFAFEESSVVGIDGNYDDYISYISGFQTGAKEQQPKKMNEYMLRKVSQSLERKRITRISKIEEQLKELENEKDSLSAALETQEVASDYVKLLECTERLEAITKEIDTLTEEWLELSSQEE